MDKALTGVDLIPGAAILLTLAALCFLATAILAGAGKQGRPAVVTLVAGWLLLSLHAGLTISHLRRLPLVGGYEAVTVLSWTIATLLLVRGRLGRDRAVLVLSGPVLGLMSAGAVFFRLQLNHDYFMYASLLSQGFFFFKLLSAGLLLTVSLALLATLAACRPLFDKRLFMAGAIVFLCSELSGSIWCLRGWGDSWHWSDNFFESMLVFFVFMVNFHLPPSLFSRNSRRMPLHLASALIITGLFLW